MYICAGSKLFESCILCCLQGRPERQEAPAGLAILAHLDPQGRLVGFPCSCLCMIATHQFITIPGLWCMSEAVAQTVGTQM